MAVDAQQFLHRVRPALSGRDPQRLADLVRENWTSSELYECLAHADPDIRRVAAAVLGLVGERSAIRPLVHALRDDDAHVNRMAEHSLWAIWFRLGSASAAEPFRRGIELLGEERYADAIARFHQALEIDPEFAEAWNQCGIACYFQGDYQRSLRCACRAASLMPSHFGAIAGLGHCYAQLGDLNRALLCYRKALQIHPRMAGVQNARDQIQMRLMDLNGASGVFSTPKTLA